MTVRIGFIGTGGIAAYHLRNLADMDGVDVVGFADLVPERAAKAAAEWPDAKAYTNAADMLDDRKPDALYICLPPMAHGEAEKLAVERGIPFFVEKPLGLDDALPTEIAALVAGKNLVTSVGFHWRYSESVQTAKRLLNGQTPGMALGYWLGDMPGTPWWKQKHASGGQFVEQTIHIVDMLRYVCGEVVEVYAAFNQVGSYADEVTVPDVGSVTMKLANGMVATVSNTCMLSVDGRVGLDVYTAEGALEIGFNRLKHRMPGQTVEYAYRGNPQYAGDAAFVSAVRTGDRTPILSDYADALKTQRIVVAANRSADSGEPVRLKH